VQRAGDDVASAISTDHRDLAIARAALHPPADLGPGQIGQHQVEQDQIRPQALDLRQGFLPRHGDQGLMTVQLQAEAKELCDVIFVLDDEHRLMAVTVDGFCDGLMPRWQR